MATTPKGYTPNLKVTSPWGLALGIAIVVIIGLLLAGLPQEWRTQEGILGTSASLMADLTILAYLLLLIPMMLAGFVFARNKQFVPHHQVVMTTIIIANWGLIAFIMANSLRGTLDAEVSDTTAYRFLPLLHAAFGVSAQILGTYLVVRMWFEDELPAWAKLQKIKPAMRLTLAGWLIAASLGIITYITWYDPFSSAETDVTPATTPEATEPADAMSATEAVVPAETEAAVPIETEAVEAAETEAAAPIETEAAAPIETESAEAVETEAVEYNDLENYGSTTQDSEPVATEEPAETEEALATTTPTLRPSNTPRPTNTQRPSLTATDSGPTQAPTNTPRPTNTQRPTRTPTAAN
jgi:uncharacterized membrane protein YozB (DUF420 family)